MFYEDSMNDLIANWIRSCSRIFHYFSRNWKNLHLPIPFIVRLQRLESKLILIHAPYQIASQWYHFTLHSLICRLYYKNKIFAYMNQGNQKNIVRRFNSAFWSLIRVQKRPGTKMPRLWQFSTCLFHIMNFHKFICCFSASLPLKRVTVIRTETKWEIWFGGKHYETFLNLYYNLLLLTSVSLCMYVHVTCECIFLAFS